MLSIAHRTMFSRAIAAMLVVGLATGISGWCGFGSCLRRCAESEIRCTPTMQAASHRLVVEEMVVAPTLNPQIAAGRSDTIFR